MTVQNVAALPPVPCGRCGGVNRAQARFCRHCGANLGQNLGQNLSAAAPAGLVTEPPSTVAGEPPSPRSLRRRILIVTAVVAIVAAGFAVFYRVQTTGEQSPKGPVKAFFTALERNDFAQALKYVGSSSPLLKAGALTKGYRPPGSIKIGDITYGKPGDDTKRPNKNLAWVKVEFDIGENHYESVLQLERERSGITRSWRIVSGATGYLDVITPSLETVRVAGADVLTIPEERASKAVDDSTEALPGEYVITVDNPLLSANVVAHVVGGRAERLAEIEVPLKVQPDATGEVSDQIRARIDECAKTTDLNPDDCPFGLGEFVNEPSGVHWNIDSYPDIEVKLSDDAAFAPAEVHTKTPGRATVTYTHLSEQKTTTVDIKVAGGVSVEKNKVTWD